jgi:hypothetical protein
MSKQKADVILYLMQKVLGGAGKPLPALLDSRRAKLRTYRASSQNLDPLLAGEALSLCEMWKQV